MTDMEILRGFNAPEGARLVKVFKNGNIQIERKVVCDRCYSPDGIYYIGVCNGHKVPSHVDGGVCFKCLGAGFVMAKEILRTPENEAKHQMELEKKRAEAQKKAEEYEKAMEAKRLEEEAEAKRLEAERIAEEERIRAEKKVSQYVGEAGQKIETEAVYLCSPHFECQDFYASWITRTVYIHTFVDGNGNKLIWKTSSNSLCDLEKGQKVVLSGIVKEHKEYKDEKQTILNRCKIKKA